MAQLEPRQVEIAGGTALVRTALAADAREVLALRKRLSQETDMLSREPDEIRLSVEEQAAVLEQRAQAPGDLYLLAEQAGRLLAIASLDAPPQRRYAHRATLGLAVLREHWGRGLGTALLRTLLDWADARGVIRVALEVVASNQRAIRLYEASGFKREGVLRADRLQTGELVDSWVMARVRLPGAGRPGG